MWKRTIVRSFFGFSTSMLVYTRVNNLIMRVTSTTINQPPARISNSNPICYHNAGLWKVARNRVVWYQRVDWVFAHSGSLLHYWRVTLLFKASNISSSTRELQDDAAEISVDIKPTANSAQLKPEIVTNGCWQCSTIAPSTPTSH